MKPNSVAYADFPMRELLHHLHFYTLAYEMTCEKERSETWTRFRHSLHLPHTGCTFEISYCPPLAAFPAAAVWLASWTTESCNKGRAKRYKKKYLFQSKNTSYSSSIKRSLKSKEKIYCLELNIHHWVLWPLCYFLPSCA